MANPDVFLMDVARWALAASRWLAPRSRWTARPSSQHLSLVDIYDGQLLALPVYMDAGLLYYRQDLLDKFGFPRPPETWPELLEQAQIIQRQVRQHTPNFFGFVWQGKQYEGLITNFQEFAGPMGLCG
jgi:multiple sugar transport system substrate-binding protein